MWCWHPRVHLLFPHDQEAVENTILSIMWWMCVEFVKQCRNYSDWLRLSTVILMSKYHVFYAPWKMWYSIIIFRSTPPSRPNKLCLKCPPVRPFVRLSAKSFSDFNEILCVGRGRRVMHDSVQYDPIQGQGHEPFKVGNSAIFKSYLLPPL